MVALDAGTALTAAIYIETVFQLPGLGHLSVRTLSGEAFNGGYDLPFLNGIVFTIGVFVLLLSDTADIASAWLDPRIRARTGTGLIRLPRMLRARCVERHHPQLEIRRSQREALPDDLRGKRLPAARRQHTHRLRPARGVVDDSYIAHASHVKDALDTGDAERGRRPDMMRRLDDRCVLNGILFVLTTGIAWQRLPR